MADVEKILRKASIREKIFMVWAIIATVLLGIFILVGVKVVLTWPSAIAFSIAMFCGVIVWAVKNSRSSTKEANVISRAVDEIIYVVKEVNHIQLSKPVQWMQIPGKEELLFYFETQKWYAWYDLLSSTFKVREAQRMTMSQIQDKIQRDELIKSVIQQGRLPKTAVAKLAELVPQAQIIKEEESETQ